MANSVDLKQVVRQFDVSSSIAPYGNGHINDTYCVGTPRLILQRINTNIFKDPDGLMENIENVTAFLRKKIAAEGGNPDRETLTVIKTIDGKNCYKYDDNNVFRAYIFIENTKSIETDKTYEDLHEAGIGFGRFQRMLEDFPVEILHETIPNFHNTVSRYNDFMTALANDVAGRASECAYEIEEIKKHEPLAHVVVDALANGEIPLRVTHNDTKLNNVMIDNHTNKGICVIDLDTVMPGYSVNDFGDSIRFGANTAVEDETDLSKVTLSLELFEAYAKGFIGGCGGSLTETELDLLPVGAMMMTFECGMRFLTDYLEGDTYFKIHRPKHNLDRARNQFALVADMERKLPEMKAIVDRLK